MTTPQSTEPLIDRIRFDIIARTSGGMEWRIWTDGPYARWEATDETGQIVEGGSIPLPLFRLAALTLAQRCEGIATGEDETIDNDRDRFVEAWHDSLRTPIELAAAHPFWHAPDDERNDLRCGFASVATNTAIDVQPDGLKPRGGA